ncbi:protein kinase [Gemmata sp. G18]|uniref:Protein kinase n=1 Tax=Gemmata palustris TaxID=2822762 RepID=A0ABS5BWX3_9BACT|nr:serine/threonine-protein kinase [Gemmata palustris]MBP3958246.1 protein kinase [Gemmata palustris]
MATPATTAREYRTLLAKSKLLPPEEVEAQYRQWQQERPGSDDRVDSFRRFLVARKCLTDYQAALLQRGRSDGFFLGGYKILDRIGKGQMGGVYKAVHNFGQLVALKILPASKAKNPHTLGRFQREARLLTQLDHPNVVRAYQVGESSGVHYIAMEVLEGETLGEALERRKQLPWAEAARLMRQVLDGLQHLHDRRTVHRDLKPTNIMLVPEPVKGKPDTTWDATAKILDVGLGRELFDDEIPEGQIDTQLTQEGSVLGTPDYLAPEQAKDARSADIRADIYSAGCVLYHCVTGRTPFPDANIMAQILKHATEKPAPLGSIVPDLPAGFQQVVDRFMAKAPNERFQTPAEAAAALKPFDTGGAPAAPSKIAPAYKDWLASESQLEMPKEILQDTIVRPHAAVPAKAAGPAISATSKSSPGKAVPAPKSGTTSLPAKPAPARPAPVPVPAPLPLPVPIPIPAVEEVDVELVTEPMGAPLARPVPVPPVRPLWQPDRRDWIMLAAGATGVLSAVGIGYGLARALRRKSEPTEEEK